MLFCKRRTLSVNDLRRVLRERQSEIDEKKKCCRIMIIDDDIESEDYLLKESIRYLQRTLMMDVRTFPDIESFDDAKPFDIIVCDYEGVGRKIGLPDGIDLVKRLKDLYNDKLFAIMSQETFYIRKLKMDKDILIWDKTEMSDAFRNSTPGKLEERVMDLVNVFADPASRWESIRTRLLKRNMSIHDVARLESAYVQSIIYKDKTYYDKAVGKLDSPSYDKDEQVLKYIKTAASIIGTIISFI